MSVSSEKFPKEGRVKPGLIRGGNLQEPNFGPTIRYLNKIAENLFALSQNARQGKRLKLARVLFLTYLSTFTVNSFAMVIIPALLLTKLYPSCSRSLEIQV